MSWQLIVAADVALMGAYGAAVWLLAGRRAARREERARDEAFEHQLLHDDLTKLPNRTLFRDRLERALARSVRRRQACAVLSIDVDRFKLVTDGLGPSAGDTVLREIATRLDSCIRPEDTVARTGGDEFMLLLESVAALEDATAVADRVSAALATPVKTDGREVFVTASAGLALGRGGRDRPEDVMRNADVAVHRAKEAGGARCQVFRQEMSPHPAERLGLETDLRRALDRMEFFVEYQPEVELASGRVVGMEALVRWQHPSRGVVPPDEFVGIAEETGMALKLGRWVLGEACSQAAAWRDADKLAVSVNLSARELQQARIRTIDEVSSVLATSGLPADALTLEIKESAVMQDADAALATMGELKRLGVRLALDDFGSGYSSLTYLRRLPLDLVKIDRAFVAELAGNEEGQAIVHALVEVCHAVGAKVLAEGVEGPEQARLLRELGCELGQGDAFSPPLDAEAATRLLASGRPLVAANAGNAT
jgi:diguanylate cyclase (GGDEF)-like protein